MYFTVNNAEDEREHIGTLNASSDRELSEKLYKALEAHFDADVTLNEPVKMVDCCRGNEKTITIELDDYRTQITISETWLY